jgi:phosphoglycerate dehydrogenase-like enzyme
MSKHDERPLVFCIPEPRTLDLIFTETALLQLHQDFRLIEAEGQAGLALLDKHIGEIDFIIGQPPLSTDLLARATRLRAILNVESNFLDNMDYEQCFVRGIYVLSTGKVFAQPVAEIGLGLALALERNIVGADRDFRAGKELWGGDGNQDARLMSGGKIGFIGFGDLGRALNKLLIPFRAKIRAYDPWLPPSALCEAGVTPSTLDEVLTTSDVIFVVAGVTTENGGFLGGDAFAKMQRGTSFVLLSRAGVVDFEALMAAVSSGHIRAASDVYPEEPLALHHPVRKLDNFILSAHRAGALVSAFKDMGRMVLEDLHLLSRRLPPSAMRRAERETVQRFRSKPVAKN